MKYAEKPWYQRSPVIAQSAIVSFWGLAARIARNGALFRRILEELEESEWYSADQFQAMQDEKLRELIAHCYEYVPFYRDAMQERGITPRDIETTADLSKLPLLTKDDLLTRGDELRSERLTGKRTYLGSTSGTTGTPLSVLRDAHSVSFEQAAIWRHWKLAGLPLWGRRATLRGDPIVPVGQARPPYWRYNLAETQLLLSSFHVSRETAPDFARAIREFRPIALQAYPTSVYFLAKAMLDSGERASVDVVFTASEPLYPAQREIIKEALSCRVFDFYGLAERVAFAMECGEHSGLHIAPEYGIVELIEPEVSHPKGTYEIVGTGLVNRAMPLLRYRTGDLTRLVSGACPCGRKMPKISGIETRKGDMLLTPEGRMISYSGLTHAFMGLSNILKSQLVQDELDHIKVLLVPGEEYVEENGRHAEERLRVFLGEQIRIDICLVDDIPPEPSGKFRWVVSHVVETDWEGDTSADEGGP